MRILTRREHSQRELQIKLRLRKFDHLEIDKVLKELKELDLQSDLRFAESYAQMRINKGYGPIRIANELQERGIDDTTISAVISADNEFWLQHAKKVHKKKFSRKAVNINEKAKQVRFMQYRGFSSEHCSLG